MKPLYIFLCFALLLNCGSNNDDNDNCNFLLEINVNYQIDLNLPQYSQLNFDGNSIYIPNIGNNGVIVAHIGGNYMAWDASDPNHAPSACSAIEPEGLFGECGCGDGNRYNFITGEPDNNDALSCALKFYPVNKSGNIIYISN
ncbi:hypothetical protein Q4566_10330 [Tamlana sp. 2_MG-2023]|uniref:Rieske (2Fe-2S) protein n=1 Tax=unclassified Tamlana TaxID=2614803 RepID=UPI0026E2DF11|nr:MULTISPECIES: hypothetical protein [unclassified Tamlana]MDO6760596.1 hypothetical protein [Tamlana sp. 2_MG-2023]MDO6790852.1 hypothetical protein [Tamlana sp. 1_MG-2023]